MLGIAQQSTNHGVREGIQMSDILGNLEIPARTCPGKKEDVWLPLLPVILAVKKQSVMLLDITNWYLLSYNLVYYHNHKHTGL